MGVNLRMEPYATMCEQELPEWRIFDELCFQNIDKLFASLGLSLDDFYAVADEQGRLPHDAALKLLGKAGVLHYYRDWYEHPDRVAAQMMGISRGAGLAWRAESVISRTSVPG